MKCLLDLDRKPCEKADIEWYNSKGELFMVCKRHLEMLQMVVDDFEKIGEKQYRVLKRDEVTSD